MRKIEPLTSDELRDPEWRIDPENGPKIRRRGGKPVWRARWWHWLIAIALTLGVLYALGAAVMREVGL